MTYVLLNTSTPRCEVTIVSRDKKRHIYEWQAERMLAHGLLRFLSQTLAEHKETFASIQGLGVYRGPGSFTGLRIGLTVLNTVASGQSIPIVGESDDGWKTRAVERLDEGKNDRLVTPLYGADARITTPRK